MTWFISHIIRKYSSICEKLTSLYLIIATMYLRVVSLFLFINSHNYPFYICFWGGMAFCNIICISVFLTVTRNSCICKKFRSLNLKTATLYVNVATIYFSKLRHNYPFNILLWDETAFCIIELISEFLTVIRNICICKKLWSFSLSHTCKFVCHSCDFF